MRPAPASIVAGSLLLVAACSFDSGTTPATTTSPTDTPVAVSPSVTGGVASAATLRCDSFIDTHPPPSGWRVIDGVVAFPASPRSAALQTSRTGSAQPAVRLFAKAGLDIRTGRSLTLSVPPRLASVASIGWGAGAAPALNLTIVGCHASSPARWLAYPGGYYVQHPLCLPLLVQGNGETQSVHIGVGKACAGQKPPPEPTQR